jgi:hypothetical protein
VNIKSRLLVIIAGAIGTAGVLLTSSCASSPGGVPITLTFTILDRVVEHGPVDFSVPIQSSGDSADSQRTASVDEDTLTPAEFEEYLRHAQGPGEAAVLARPRLTLLAGEPAAIVMGDQDNPPWFRIESSALRELNGDVTFTLFLDGRHPGDDRPYHQERAGVIPSGQVLLLMMTNGRDLRDIRFHVVAIEASGAIVEEVGQ